MTRHSTNPWLILVLICFAQFMVVLDGTVVNVALPSIQKDLGLSEANLQWIVNAYTLVFGGFLLLGGRAGDLLGRKRLFLFGLVVFTTASLLDGLSSSSGMLIGARGLQGLGAAFISPAALAIITTTFAEGAERAKALGVWAAIAIGGSAVGLILGGALTQYFSWPWVFFINVPVGIAVFFASLRYVPESKDELAHRSFDVAGAVTVTGGLMTLVYAIVQAQEKGWTSAQTIGTFVLSAVLLVSFVVIELRAKAPLVRLSIFRTRSLTAANITMFLVGAGLFAMFFFNSLYLQRVLGYGPLDAGLAFLPFTGGIILSAGFASKYAPKFGVRPVAIGGMIVTAAGMLLLTQLPVDGTYVANVLPALVLTSLGLGCVFVPLTLVATTGLVNEDQGLASGPVQHVAADRRRARAGDPRDIRGEPDVERHRGLAVAGARGRLPRRVPRRGDLRPRRARRVRPRCSGGATSRRSRPRRPPCRSDDRAPRGRAAQPRPRARGGRRACFAERGVDVSIDEIARRAGVGHGTVFRRFPTKDALLDGGRAASGRRELAAAAEAALEEPTRARLRAVLPRGRRPSTGATGRSLEGSRPLRRGGRGGRVRRGAVGRLVARARRRAGALRRDVTPRTCSS